MKNKVILIYKLQPIELNMQRKLQTIPLTEILFQDAKNHGTFPGSKIKNVTL